MTEIVGHVAASVVQEEANRIASSVTNSVSQDKFTFWVANNRGQSKFKLKEYG